MNETRDRIVLAAAEILDEDPQTRPSVRAVAARAGIGASTLRYYFPTQRDLLDAMLSELFSRGYPALPPDDGTASAAERLAACVAGLLEPMGHGEQAREAMRGVVASLLEPGHRSETSMAMTRINETAMDATTSWLEALEAEGSLSPGDHRRRALLLLTVVDGLSLARALPGANLTDEQEAAVIADAVAAALAPDAPSAAQGGSS